VIVDEAFEGVIDALAAPRRTFLKAPDAYERLLAAAEDAGPHKRVGEDDLATIFYSGGTSDVPKGVMLTHRNLVANAFNTTIAFGYCGEDVFLYAAPMFHLAGVGFIHALTWQGARHVFAPKFDPAAVLACIERECVTCMTSVPTMIGGLVNHSAVPRVDLSSLRLVVYAGAPISPTLLRDAAAVLAHASLRADGGKLVCRRAFTGRRPARRHATGIRRPRRDGGGSGRAAH